MKIRFGNYRIFYFFFFSGLDLKMKEAQEMRGFPGGWEVSKQSHISGSGKNSPCCS